MLRRLADEMGFAEARNLEPYEFRYLESVIGDVLVTRMGFTADLGYEFWMSPQQCTGFTAQIDAARRALSLRIPGYGLNALEACRIEGGFVVAGWDFSTELDPQPGSNEHPLRLALAGWSILKARTSSARKHFQRSRLTLDS